MLRLRTGLAVGLLTCLGARRLQQQYGNRPGRSTRAFSDLLHHGWVGRP